jgi:5-methylcytosine-specific restriction enzyme subunit McrC
LLACFEQVSDDISFSEIKRIKVNALYKEYVEAIELAKMILKHFGYSFKRAGEKEKELPPFWIDMSALFELYVYSLLRDAYGNTVVYQTNDSGTKQNTTHGTYGYVDFLKKDEQLIIDTKYKEIYQEEKGYDIDNIRQLSGYARDTGVLKKLAVFKAGTKDIDDEKVVDCVIIYPDTTKSDNFESRKLQEEEISGFTKFYKCGIKLPKKS